MKIGILTFHRTANFGSALQAYALCRKVKDLGGDCDLIDYRCPAVENREGIGKFYDKTLKKTIIRLLQMPHKKKKYASLMGFLKQSVNFSNPYVPATIGSANDEYDRFIVGSDIVWGTDITEGDYTFFLNFVSDNRKKYAFASSVGNCDRYEKEEKEQVKQLLGEFRHIAVREKDACQWIRALTEKDVDFVCDPTMLLTADEWTQAVKPKTYKQKYVLVYFTDNSGKIFEDAKAYAQREGLEVYFISSALKPTKGVKNINPASLAEFLGLIQNAAFVFTASYHGMLFSMYFRKDFVFYTRAHSARVISLAEHLGLSDRCANEMTVEDFTPIDYTLIDDQIIAFREKSVAILKEMLEQ